MVEIVSRGAFRPNSRKAGSWKEFEKRGLWKMVSLTMNLSTHKNIKAPQVMLESPLPSLKPNRPFSEWKIWAKAAPVKLCASVRCLGHSSVTRSVWWWPLRVKYFWLFHQNRYQNFKPLGSFSPSLCPENSLVCDGRVDDFGRRPLQRRRRGVFVGVERLVSGIGLAHRHLHRVASRVMLGVTRDVDRLKSEVQKNIPAMKESNIWV